MGEGRGKSSYREKAYWGFGNGTHRATGMVAAATMRCFGEKTAMGAESWPARDRIFNLDLRSHISAVLCGFVAIAYREQADVDGTASWWAAGNMWPPPRQSPC